MQVAQTLGVKIVLINLKRSDVAFGATARYAGEIESRRDGRSTGNDPVFRVKRLIFLKIDNYGRDSVDHRRRGAMKTVFDITFSVLWSRGQLAHDNDQIFLCGQDFFREKLFD